MLGDFFKLAMNNLKRRKLRSWLTMIGIFIGIAAVVALISLGQGLQTAIAAQFTSMSTDELVIENAGTGFGPPGSTVVEKLTDHDVRVISRVRGVKEVIPTLLRIAKVEYNNIAKFEYIVDLPEDPQQREMVYTSSNLKAEQGRLLKSGDSGKIVIGADIAKKEEFDKKVEVGKTLTVQGGNFEVVGILKKTGSFTVNQVIYMPNSEMEDLFDIEDEIDIITVKVENSKEIEEVARRIEKEMRKDRDLDEGEEDFSVQTPLESLEAVNNILGIVNIVIVGIAMISLIVGGIGIANTMYTSVLERKKEIGTMKAIGAKNSDILWVFLIESGLFGLVGGIVGALIGIGLALGIEGGANSYFGLNIIDVAISFPLIFAAITFSFLIGILSGIIPSYQASKLKPVEALRG